MPKVNMKYFQDFVTDKYQGRRNVTPETKSAMTSATMVTSGKIFIRRSTTGTPMLIKGTTPTSSLASRTATLGNTRTFGTSTSTVRTGALGKSMSHKVTADKTAVPATTPRMSDFKSTQGATPSSSSSSGSTAVPSISRAEDVSDFSEVS